MSIGRVIAVLSHCFALACLMRGEAATAPSTTDEGRHLVLQMQIHAVEKLRGSGLIIAADFISDSEPARVEIRGPPGHWKKDKLSPPGHRWYRFPVFFESNAKGRETIDRLVSKKFGNGQGATLFKSKGYSGSSFQTTQQLGQVGGKLSIVDAGIEGTVAWSIDIEIDPKGRLLTLNLSEMSF